MRIILVFLCTLTVWSNDSNLFKKSQVEYEKKYTAIKSQYDHKLKKLEKSYHKATLQLAQKQVAELKSLLLIETKKGNSEKVKEIQSIIDELEKGIKEALNPKRSDKGKNYALAINGATATSKTKADRLIDGNTTEYDGGTGFAYGSYPCVMTVTLANKTRIGLIKVLLWDGDERSYKYKLETSPDGINWTTQADHSKEGQKSWQIIQFKVQEIKYIKLHGLHNSANGGFHVVEIEAY